MTNTGTGIQGFRTKPTRHDHHALQDWLKQDFGDLIFWRRDLLQNRIEQACKYWFIQGGGDPEEFEWRFNGEKKQTV